MRRSALALVVACSGAGGLLHARDLAAQDGQLALDIGILSAGLSYAQHAPRSHVGFGAGVWVAWQPPSTFNRNVFEPRGVAVFARVSRVPGVQIDAGLGLLRYQYGDDCSRCSGTLVGLRLGAHLGSRHVLFGPDVWVGVANDSSHGSNLGLLLDLQVRLVTGSP